MVIINGKSFPVEYMDTPEKTQKGMMGRTKLDGCMVFKMEKGHHSFWMKGCLIPIDIVFVNNNKINKIHTNCQPAGKNELNPKRYNGIGDTVIEFPANTSKDWKIGDRVYFDTSSTIS